MSKKLSVSQLQEYAKCQKAYYLSRVQKAPQLTAAWFIQGSVVHESIDFYEKSFRQVTSDQAESFFLETWDRYVSKALESHPNEADWIPSGRRKRETDLQARKDMGLEQVRGYLAANPPGADIAPIELVPGEPAVEVGFELDFDGVRVIGYLDAIMSERSTGRIFPEDWKTGREAPSDPYQLATYKFAIQHLTGCEVEFGRYWMCRENKPVVLDLRGYSWGEVADWYHQLTRGIENKVFLANPGDCHTCTVKRSCKEGQG